ncbi:MAG: hypothetical protein O7B99_10715 [Planctomycetota bacterium]|nr:hypothetical protein [Planctomycetota bacterium]
MPSSTPARRRCPTRPDGGEVLIAHTIDRETCQERQRGHYHKCFTCVHQNGAEPAPAAAARGPAVPAGRSADEPVRGERTPTLPARRRIAVG